MKTDIQIAQEAEMLHIREVAAKIGIEEEDLEFYGKYKAKLSKFPNIVAMYRAFHGLLKESFEKKRKGRRSKDVSDFNRFMSANLQSAPVFLTQSESAAGYSFAGYGGRSCAKYR